MSRTRTPATANRPWLGQVGAPTRGIESRWRRSAAWVLLQGFKGLTRQGFRDSGELGLTRIARKRVSRRARRPLGRAPVGSAKTLVNGKTALEDNRGFSASARAVYGRWLRQRFTVILARQVIRDGGDGGERFTRPGRAKWRRFPARAQAFIENAWSPRDGDRDRDSAPHARPARGNRRSRCEAGGYSARMIGLGSGNRAHHATFLLDLSDISDGVCHPRRVTAAWRRGTFHPRRGYPIASSTRKRARPSVSR
jgi:hypothetical protein